jgi:prevent-host-death family protein
LTATTYRNFEGIAMRISVSQAAKRLSELVRRATRGESIIITRYRKPVVRLHSFLTSRRAEDERILRKIINNSPFRF